MGGQDHASGGPGAGIEEKGFLGVNVLLCDKYKLIGGFRMQSPEILQLTFMN